jgi:hypothetical protein
VAASARMRVRCEAFGSEFSPAARVFMYQKIPIPRLLWGILGLESRSG